LSDTPVLRRDGSFGDGERWLIRPARDEDAAMLVALRDEVAAEGGLVAAAPGERSVLEEQLAIDSVRSGGGMSIVCEAGGEVIGQLQVLRRLGSYEGHVGDLSVSLRPAYRRRGLGVALLLVAIEWARAVRLRKLCLAVFPDNRPAIAAYSRVGFVEEGLQRAQLHVGGEDRDVLLMGLRVE
jgi:RimJ/RimL family protein N-acetyltransferase